MQTMTAYIVQVTGGDAPAGSTFIFQSYMQLRLRCLYLH